MATTTPTAARSSRTLHLGHSPDPDDAFMWYPLANFPNGTGPGGGTFKPRIDTRGYEFIHILEDIQSLNDRSLRGELEITAISIHQYPYVADKYALTSCGSSMGDNYGPMIVAPASGKLQLEDLTSPKITIAVPGTRTTAFLALSLLLGKDTFRYKVVPFDQIIARVVAGEFDAGLIIHEGQLTYANAGLRKLVDLGQWWTSTRGLPLPLGGNAIRRDLSGGRDEMRRVCTILLDSIRYALDHRDEAVRYALAYARDMGTELADKFVGMYVNQWTIDYGDIGRRAVNQLLAEAARAHITPDIGTVDFVDPM
ncbi:MAG: ABC transporter substrate-binding protein [Phycisphaeraceae bacterium]|nr:ABC transporter substrate-binding protein [Phycisphaeraceae bacterium]